MCQGVSGCVKVCQGVSRCVYVCLGVSSKVLQQLAVLKRNIQGEGADVISGRCRSQYL